MTSTKVKNFHESDELGQPVPPRTWAQYLKDRIIQISYQFNLNRFSPPIFSSCLIFCSYFQIYDQLLDSPMVPRTSDEWGPFQFVATFLDFARLTPIIDGAGTAYSLTFLYSFFCMNVLFLLSFYYMHYSITIKRLFFIFPIEVASLYGSFLLWIIIFPVSEIYVMTYYCNDNGMATFYPDIVCWSTMHSIHTIFATFGLLFHIVSAFLVAFYSNESRPSTAAAEEDGMTRLDTNMEVYYLCFRIIIGLFARLILNKSLNWLLLLLHFLYAAAFSYNYCRFIPYYNRLTSSVYGGCIATHVWLILNLILFDILGGDASANPNRYYKGVAVVFCVGMAISFACCSHLRDQLIKHKLIDIHHAKITNDEELDLYVQSMLQLYDMQQIHSSDELLLRGIVGRHKAECLDPECPLHKPDDEKLYHPATDTESDNDKTNVKDKIIILVLINSILRERERRLGDLASACFHLIYSNFLFTEMGNVHMAIVEVMKAQKASPSSQQEVSIFQLLRCMEDFLVKKYRKKGGEGHGSAVADSREPKGFSQGLIESMDVTIVIKFENWLMHLVKVIEKCAGEHIEFWSHLESLLPDLNELNRIGLNILLSSRSIEDIWRKINKINPNHPKALNTYGYYLRDIKNDPELGQECIEKAISINLHKSVVDDINNEFELMFAEDTAIIVINGSPDYLGKITKTNAGVFKLFGYNPYEIYGNDVSILMPGLFAQQHPRFMHRYFETGRNDMIQKVETVFALHRNNYLFCVSIMIKPVPSLATAVPHYIGLLRQTLKEYDFIITDKHGKIDAITIGIYHTYNITANFIKENHVYIHLICPDLAEPEDYSNQKLTLAFDRIKGGKKLTFIVPRDFTSIAHLFSQTAKDPPDVSAIIAPQGANEEEDIRNKPSDAPQFFNITYKIYKSKCKGKELDFGRKNIVKECFDYTKYDVKIQATCDIKEKEFAGGMLNIRIFRVSRAKVIRRKNSLEDYYGKEEEDVGKGPQRYPSQTGRKISKFDPQAKKEDTPQLKKSITGVKVDVEPDISPSKSHRGQDSEHGVSVDFSPMQRESVPGSSEDASGRANSGHDSGPKPEEKKQSIETSMSSDKKPALKLHNIGESASNSTPDPRGISASGASEGMSGLEDDKKRRSSKEQKKNCDELPIIKIIDTRQMEVAKRLLVRKSTYVFGEKQDKPAETAKEGEPPLKPPEKKEGDNYELAEDTKKPKETKKEIDNGDTGSVATTTNNLMRIIRSLQGALHEVYSPPAIGQLQWLACIVFIVLLGLTITIFVLSSQVYSSLSTHLNLVIASRDRTSSLANIAGCSQLLTLIGCSNNICLNTSNFDYNPGTQQGINYTFGNTTMYYSDWVNANLGNYSFTLKNAQDNISEAGNSFSSQNEQYALPNNIAIVNLPIFGAPTQINLDCYSAIDFMVIHALSVQSLFTINNNTWLTNSSDSISYILTNGFNSILYNLRNSLSAVIDETNAVAYNNQIILMIFFIIASSSLLISISIVMPVVVKIRKNKQELLCLFLEIPIKKAKAQLDKCNLFCRMIHGETEVERQDMDEDEKGNLDKKLNDETDLVFGEEEKNPLTAAQERGQKRRKFKPYSAEIVTLVIEAIISVAILESFFLFDFLRAQWLNNTVSYLMNEVGAISSRMYSNELYYWIELELVVTNGTGAVMNNVVETYVDTYNNMILSDQELFLQIHSQNSPYNSQQYKDLFDTMLYSDVCSIIFAPDNITNTTDMFNCENYMNGVLQKGLNSANVAFWDALQEFSDDFRQSNPRDLNLQNQMIQDSRLIENHWLLYEYFTAAYNTLQSGLQSSMQSLFDYELLLLTILFAVYLLLLVIIYFAFSQVFVENTKDSLWVTKSLLTILPPEIILQVSKIKFFVLSTSKSMIYGLKTE